RYFSLQRFIFWRSLSACWHCSAAISTSRELQSLNLASAGLRRVHFGRRQRYSLVFCFFVSLCFPYSPCQLPALTTNTVFFSSATQSLTVGSPTPLHRSIKASRHFTKTCTRRIAQSTRPPKGSSLHLGKFWAIHGLAFWSALLC